jgi:hypothetical protein
MVLANIFYCIDARPQTKESQKKYGRQVHWKDGFQGQFKGLGLLADDLGSHIP